MNYISTLDFSQEQLQEMLDLAKQFKADGYSDELKGKVLTAVFYNPSLRTLLSFQTGMQKLGGIANVMQMGDSRKLEYGEGTVMDGGASEHIKEFVKVVASYSDVIAVRKSDFIPNKKGHQNDGISKEDYLADKFFDLLVELSDKPVINMESNMFHPCQSLADMLTMQEILGDVKKKKYVLTWAPHTKALPLATPHSQMITPSIFGMDVVVACPPEFNLDAGLMEKARMAAEKAGGSFEVTHDQKAALEGADIVCAKSWMSLENYGLSEFASEAREKYADWMVDDVAGAKFMHCLPVRRNLVASDSVIDNSVVIQEAENRMWAQMGILSYLLKGSTMKKSLTTTK